MNRNGAASYLYVRRHEPVATLACPHCRRHVEIVLDERTNIHSFAVHDPCAGGRLPVVFLPERYAVVAMVLNQLGEILTVSRKNNHEDLGLPGGKAEPGEDPFAAVVRETEEETSIRILKARYVYWRKDYSKPGDARPTIPALCFLVEAYEGEPKQVEDGRVGWSTSTAIAAKTCSFHEYNRGLFDALMILYETSEAS